MRLPTPTVPLYIKSLLKIDDKALNALRNITSAESLVQLCHIGMEKISAEKALSTAIKDMLPFVPEMVGLIPHSQIVIKNKASRHDQNMQTMQQMTEINYRLCDLYRHKLFNMEKQLLSLENIDTPTPQHDQEIENLKNNIEKHKTGFITQRPDYISARKALFNFADTPLPKPSQAEIPKLMEELDRTASMIEEDIILILERGYIHMSDPYTGTVQEYFPDDKETQALSEVRKALRKVYLEPVDIDATLNKNSSNAPNTPAFK